LRVVGFRDLDLVDYIVIQDDRAVGPIYEDRQTLPDLRWFWSVTAYVDPSARPAGGVYRGGSTSTIGGAQSSR
jgi:hypothetical protein